MRVVFDAYWWVSGPPSLRHVLREIVLAWSSLYPADELTLVVRKAHLREAAKDAPHDARLEPSTLCPQALCAAVTVPAVAAARSADLVITHNFAAATPALSAVYLHDALFATNPEWFTRLERRYFSLMLRWIRRADIVLTSSESEAHRITEVTGVRAHAVGLGLSTELTAESGAWEPDPGLRAGRFVLSVGRLNARKNLSSVIAGALATGRVTAACPLVIVGSADGRSAPLSAQARAGVASGAVRFTGHISEDRLRWYYGNCAMFVYLSLGEGFGMPPVEAAYFSAPTLVSDLPVFHETLGGYARYVDPTDVAAIAVAITRGIRDADEHPPPRGTRASRHDWEKTVRAIRDAADRRLSSRVAVTS